jgi:hypothetical protein
MKRKMPPSIVPTLVQARMQSAKVPQMSSPYERQMREQRQKAIFKIGSTSKDYHMENSYTYVISM